MLMLGYTTIYTSLPVFSIVFDEDIGSKAAIQFPPLYKTLQLGRSLSVKTFLIWAFKSIYQGAVIFLGTLIFFSNVYTNMVTITFTTLILIELLNVYSTITHTNWKMIFFSVLSLGSYIVSITVLRVYFDTTYIDYEFAWKVGVLTLVAWLPLQIVSGCYSCCDPSEEQKILEEHGRD